MTSYKEAYKYPFIATEILSSKNKLIEGALLIYDNEENNNILNLIKVLDNKEVLNSTLPGYINKIINSHIENDLLYENIRKNNIIIFEILIKYIYKDSYRDLFYLFVNESVKREKKDNSDFIQKLFDILLNNMYQYITIMNNNENSEKLIDAKGGIFNIIYVFIKLAENNYDIFSIIIKKLSEGEILEILTNNLKEINEEENEEEIQIINKNNKNIFYCLNKLLILFSNLFNLILIKNEKEKYAFNKYYLLTIIEPPYNPYAYVPSYVSNTDKNKNENNEIDKEKSNNMEIELDEIIKLLIDTNITHLQEIFSIFKNNIEKIKDLNKSIIFSFYNNLTDILILILITEKKDNEKINSFLIAILMDLVQLIIDYPFYSLIHNKTLKIFQYITENNINIKKDNLIKYLQNYFNETILNGLISDEGAILNNKKESNNNIYLINILNFLEKQENKKIIEYIGKNNEGLLENEKMEPGEYVPKPDEDEIITKKKEDIHDSEAFIFTPKKVIEDSKKILKNLKQLDN